MGFLDLFRKKKPEVDVSKWSDKLANIDRSLGYNNTRKKTLWKYIPKGADHKEYYEPYKRFYQERLIALKNENIDIAVRLVWTSFDNRFKKIAEYRNLIQMIIENPNQLEAIELQFHILETEISLMVKSDSIRIVKEHPEFFE